jgi:hypothetical protein
VEFFHAILTLWSMEKWANIETVEILLIDHNFFQAENLVIDSS